MNKKLKFLANNTIPIPKRVAKIYDWIDHITTDIKAQHKVTCLQGCWYCCHVKVDVFEAEAQYIELKTSIAYNSETKFLNRPEFSHKDIGDTACPFLKDNQCSIYEYRPLACRMFFSVDDLSKCINEEHHNRITMESSDEAMHYVAALHDISPKIYDIRDWFKP